jgi:hypothetical protein
MEKYFECKRCFYKTYRKSDIIAHFNRVKKCERKDESYKYNEDEIYNLSMIRNDKINNSNETDNKCKNCNKCFSTFGNLKRHMTISCKSDNTNLNITNNTNITNNNNINNNNITQNINIQILNPFNDKSKWSIDHIDIKEQYDILTENYIYKNALEKILENDKNLNVLIKKDEALVYNNDKIEKIELKRLFRLMIEKINDTIFEFGDNIKNSEINKNLTVIKETLDLANKIFNDYKCNNDNTQTKAKIMFTNIYKNKNEKTEEILKNITNTQSIEDDASNYF